MPRQTQRWCFLMSLLATGVIFITSDCNLLQAQTETSQDFTPVTDAMLADPSDDDWLMWRRTLDGWGYSPLDQINLENVAELQMVWTRGLARGAQEGTPLAYDGVLYMPQASDTIHAINAETGDLIWAYQRSLPEDVYEYVGGNARNNRNIAIYDRFIVNTTDDNYAIGLDAVTGELAWETQIFDYRVTPAGHSSGPIVADGKMISGRSCRPAGGPESCVVVAHNAKTGEEVWRRRTVPAPGEPGDETWGEVPFEQRIHVGTWMPPSYDPELGLIYQGTSVTSPAPKFLLGGTELAHLYHNSTLALDVDTGDIRWYYQHLNDHWDLDHPFERLLVDTAVTPDASEVSWINPRLQRGERRKVVTGIPGKTGVVYTLDRETGEFLWATPTIAQNVITNIDGATGAVTENAEVTFTSLGQEVLVCPTWAGGKDWEAGAYSPLTNTMFFPLRNTCARMLSTDNVQGERELALTEGGQRPLAIYSLAARHQITPGTDDLGTVRAISVETGKTSWLYEQRAGTMSLVATGGGLLFGGDANGRFRAFDQETGDILWEINLGSPVAGYPISFAVNGRQYIAASTGTGAGINLRLTPELRPSSGNNLFVFALPETTN
ncbi:MAG: PQQ-binding-like beta-propeller repeat protein [Vicinamibacterales bacterium]